MRIKTLHLISFRNYENTEVSFGSGLNVITGLNAQGKTNLLESLVYLSLTRSHRVSNDRKLIKEGSEYASIRCVMEEDGRDIDLGAVIYPRGKTLMIQKTPVKKTSEFVGRLNVILFAPDDLRFFTDSPRERRRLLNQEITKLSHGYLLALNRYQNLLKDRNLLLKRMNPDFVYLDTLNEQMAAEEVQIIRERRALIQGTEQALQDCYRRLSGDSTAEVSLQYVSCLRDSEINKEALVMMHRDSMPRDIESHVTTAGIHREDIVFRINGRNAVDTASQGQKRMLMLSFKMALHAYIRQYSGRNAVLLLDDVLSELDREKQIRLLSMIHDTQCLITATELPPFMGDLPMNKYHVTHGTIAEEGGKK